MAHCKIKNCSSVIFDSFNKIVKVLCFYFVQNTQALNFLVFHFNTKI